MYKLKTDTTLDYGISTPNGTETISNRKIKRTTEAEDIINRAVIKQFRHHSELKEDWIESKIEDYEKTISQLKPLYFLLQRYKSEKISFPLINSYAEPEVIDDLSDSKNEFFYFTLEEIVSQIKQFLYSTSKLNKVGICIQRDPEDPSFKTYLIVINTEYKDFNEMNKIEDGICDIIDNTIHDLKDNAKTANDVTKITDVKKSITFLVDGINAKI